MNSNYNEDNKYFSYKQKYNKFVVKIKENEINY